VTAAYSGGDVGITHEPRTLTNTQSASLSIPRDPCLNE